MFSKSIQNSMVGAFIGAISGGLLMGVPGALLGGFGVGLTVYLMGLNKRTKVSLKNHMMPDGSQEEHLA